MEFQGFPKIARLSRECVVTEKIDGTNAQIYIEPIGRTENLVNISDLEGSEDLPPYVAEVSYQDTTYVIAAGSRNRWIKPGKEDNAGFAGWVADNADELIKLGPGQHFGEWWGSGIQRRYGLNEKRFSLFNTFRWYNAYQAMLAGHDENNFPKCCHVVPVLYWGPFDTKIIDEIVNDLKQSGSHAAPGFIDPEGVIVYHEAAKMMFKKTCKDDEKPKGAA